MALQIKKVLVTDEVDPKCIEILQASNVEVVKNTALAKDKAALLSEIPKYDGLIVRSGTKVTADVINASNLSIIGRAGTGVDNIDVPAATAKGVVVMNTPGGNTISAAELTCGMICSLSRRIPQANQSMREGRWDRKVYMGSELLGKTLAIVGLGRIGREVATRMQSFGMKTIGFDPLVSAEESKEFNTEWYQLDDLWPKADYVTLHVPLIPPTRNMINMATFAKCKKGVKIVNCARGGIIDEDDLIKACDQGLCGGAGLDVYLEEPPKNKALIAHPLVISTPHLGASTVEAQSRVAEEIAEQFVEAAQGKSLVGAINAPALAHALSESTKPWVELMKRLALVGWTALGSKEDFVGNSPIELTSQGAQLQGGAEYLKAALLIGLLSSKNAKGLNLINAPAMAKQLNVQVKAQHDSAAGVQPSVTVKLQYNGQQCVLRGGVSPAGVPFLAAVNEQCLLAPVLLSPSYQYAFVTAPPSHPLDGLLGAVRAVSSEAYVAGLTRTGAGSDGKCMTVAQLSGAAGVDMSSVAPGSFVCSFDN